MGQRTTKRDLILEGIDKEIASVKADIATAESKMAVYRSNLSSLYAVEHALEKLRKQTAESLVPRPRQSAGTGAKPAEKPSQVCAYVFPDDGRAYGGLICTATQDGIIHKDPNQTGYHKFVKSKKKSGTKKRAVLPTDREDENERCQYVFGDGTVCLGACDQNIHQLRGVTNYHPFTNDALSAQPPSSMNGAGASSAANTEIKQDVVSTAGTASD